MTPTRAGSFAIVANGFADGPAQALRDYLTARGAGVVVVLHPLTPEDGTRHVVTTYRNDELVTHRSVGSPLTPPVSYIVDPFIPLRHPRVDVWFGFNPLACVRGLVARRLRRARRVVLWSVDFVPDRFGRGTAQTKLYDQLDRLCCERADARVELSEVARAARNRRHRLPPDRAAAHVVPMGAWLERVPTVAERGHEARRLVLLAHLVHRQGADVLLDALAVLKARAARITADIIGTGPLEGELRARARALGIDDIVTFHGFVGDHREVERLLASASVGMAPYRPGETNFTAFADPGKLKAYLAAGLPILMTDVPPNAHELAQNGSATIVPFEATAIAEAVLRVVDSPASWKRMSAAARAHARGFDWTMLLDELLARLDLEVAPGH